MRILGRPTLVLLLLAAYALHCRTGFALSILGAQAIQRRPEPTERIKAEIDAALKLPGSKAPEKLARIAKQVRRAKDIPGEIMALLDAGEAQRHLESYADARANFESALVRSRKSKDRFSESDALCGIGNVLADREEFAAAETWFEQALALAKSVGYRLGAARATSDLAGVYANQWLSHKAEILYEQAMKDYQNLDLPADAAWMLRDLGEVNHNLGHYEKSLALYGQALRAFEALKLRRGAARVQTDIGNIYWRTGDKRALASFEQALKTYQFLKLPREAANVNMDIGNVYNDEGQYENALTSSVKALKAYQELHLARATAACQENIGVIYTELGQYTMALQVFNQALKLSQDHKLLNDVPLRQMFIGDVYHKLGQNRLALSLYEQALKAYMGLNLPGLEAGVKVKIGLALNDLGMPDRAYVILQEALMTYRYQKMPMETASAQRSLGVVHRARREYTLALADYLAALPLFWAAGDRSNLADTDLGIAKALDGLGQPEIAVLFGKEAVNQYQSIRRDVSGLPKEDRQAFLKSVEGSYRSLADMLIRQGRITEAERVLDLLKDDERYEFLRRDPAVKGVMADVELVGRENGWLARWKAVEDRAVSIATSIRDLVEERANAQRTGHPFKDDAKLRVALQEEEPVERAMAAYFDVLKAETSDHAEILTEIREKEIEAFRDHVKGPLGRLEALTNTRVAAVYGLVYEGYAHFIVATPTGEVPISVAVDAIKLNRAIADLRGSLTDPNKDPKPPGKVLYDMVLAKPIGQLHAAGIHQVMWSLDGALRYVPLAAVWDGRNYLVESDSYSGYSPLELEKLDEERDRSPKIAAFGASRGGKFHDRSFLPLPNVKMEIDSIVRNAAKGAHGVVTGDPWLDSEFTSRTFLTQMASDYYRISHIASHFDLRGDFARSALLMGDQKLLSLRDILGSGSTLEQEMRNKPWAHLDLVVLSACDTAEAIALMRGLNEDTAGAETESFASVVLGLGASSVMASLWAVSDTSTATLMARFYRNWVSGMNKAEALRQAQLSMLHPKGGGVARAGPRRSVPNNGPGGPYKSGHAFDHPYYWAPFMLYGNWR